MRRFFTEPENVDKENMTLSLYEDASHISRVLRMEVGDKIAVFDGSGYEYIAELCEINQEFSLCRIISCDKSMLEPKTKVTLYQGVPKAGKMDVIVQKAVELGVYKIVPVQMSRSVAKISDDKKGDKKILRLQKISKEAAKQCGRGILPEVTMPISFNTLLDEIKGYNLTIMLYEELGHGGEKNLKSILRENISAENIAVIVGPEGGFSSEEAESYKNLCASNAYAAGLGPRILRTETAGSTALSIIMYEKDEI